MDSPRGMFCDSTMNLHQYKRTTAQGRDSLYPALLQYAVRHGLHPYTYGKRNPESPTTKADPGCQAVLIAEHRWPYPLNPTQDPLVAAIMGMALIMGMAFLLRPGPVTLIFLLPRLSQLQTLLNPLHALLILGPRARLPTSRSLTTGLWIPSFPQLKSSTRLEVTVSTLQFDSG